MKRDEKFALLKPFLSSGRKNNMLLEYIYHDGNYYNASDGTIACRIKSDEEDKEAYLYDLKKKEIAPEGNGIIPNYELIRPKKEKAEVVYELNEKNVEYLIKIHEWLKNIGEETISLDLTSGKIMDLQTEKVRAKFQTMKESKEKKSEKYLVHYDINGMIKILIALQKINEYGYKDNIKINFYGSEKRIYFEASKEIELYLMPIKILKKELVTESKG